MKDLKKNIKIFNSKYCYYSVKKCVYRKKLFDSCYLHLAVKTVTLYDSVYVVFNGTKILASNFVSVCLYTFECLYGLMSVCLYAFISVCKTAKPAYGLHKKSSE